MGILGLWVLVEKADSANIALFFDDEMKMQWECKRPEVDLNFNRNARTACYKNRWVLSTHGRIWFSDQRFIKRRCSRSRLELTSLCWKWTNKKMYSNICTVTVITYNVSVWPHHCHDVYFCPEKTEENSRKFTATDDLKIRICNPTVVEYSYQI